MVQVERGGQRSRRQLIKQILVHNGNMLLIISDVHALHSGYFVKN